MGGGERDIGRCGDENKKMMMEDIVQWTTRGEIRGSGARELRKESGRGLRGRCGEKRE